MHSPNTWKKKREYDEAVHQPLLDFKNAYDSVHVERMEDNRLTKIARDNRPQGVCSRGWPKKWKESLNTDPSP
jgi:hypothetical protein